MNTEFNDYDDYINSKLDDAFDDDIEFFKDLDKEPYEVVEYSEQEKRKHKKNSMKVEQKQKSKHVDNVELREFGDSDKLSIAEKALNLKNRTNKNKNKILNQNDIMNETIEAKVFEVLKEVIVIESKNKLMYLYNKDLGYYQYINHEKLMMLASDTIEQLGLFKYQKKSVYESCASTIEIDLFKNAKDYVTFDNACITAHIEDNEYYNKTVHLKFDQDINDPDGVCITIEKAKKGNNSRIYSPVKIPLSHITNARGEKFDGNFMSCKWKYTPSMIKNGLYSKLITAPWQDEEHLKAAQMLKGGWLTGISSNISPVTQSGGGTGKTEQLSVDSATFPGMYMDYDAESNNDFNLDGIQGIPNLVVDESGEVMNEKTNKKLSGNSTIAVKRKFLGHQQFDTTWVFQSFYINRAWKSKDQGDSIERRYFYLHQDKKPKEIIEGIADIIINGKRTRKDGKWVVYENDLYSCFAFQMEGALKVFDLGRFPTPRDFGGSVLEFNHKMLKITMNMKSFFSEFEFGYAHQKQLGITKKDLYKIYVDFMQEQGTNPKNRQQLLDDFENEFNKKKLDTEPKIKECRLKKGMGYPIYIKSEYYQELNKDKLQTSLSDNVKSLDIDDIKFDDSVDEF